MLWIVTTVVVAMVVAWTTYIQPTVLDHVGDPVEAVADLLTPGVTEHVIVISIDGLRPDAIERFGATTLQRLMRDGRYTLRASTIFPPKTLPSHASMLTGTPPAEHGITWNDDQTGEHGFVQVPTIFGIARSRGLSTAAFFSKTKFEHLALPNDFDFLQRPRGGIIHIPAGDIESAAMDLIEREKPNLLFVHISDVDFTGHRIGWMSYLYGRAVRIADDAVGDIIERANETLGCGNYTVIVTSDHGGHGRDHGLNQPSDMLIPWITWGRGVKGAGPLTESVNTMDTAASTLWLLGIAPPRTMDGVPVREAYRTEPPVLLPPAELVPIVRGCP